MDYPGGAHVSGNFRRGLAARRLRRSIAIVYRIPCLDEYAYCLTKAAGVAVCALRDIE
jgi:hypothetical protein